MGLKEELRKYWGEQDCDCKIPGEESFKDYLENKKMQELTEKTGIKPGRPLYKWMENMIKREHLQGQIDALEWAIRRNKITLTAEAYRKDIQEMINLVQHDINRLESESKT